MTMTAAFPDLCCSKTAVVRRLLEMDADHPNTTPYFSPGLILPFPRGPERETRRERRRRAVRLAALKALAREGIVQEPPDMEGVYRLAPLAAVHYRKALRHPTFTRVRG